MLSCGICFNFHGCSPVGDPALDFEWSCLGLEHLVNHFTAHVVFGSTTILKNCRGSDAWPLSYVLSFQFSLLSANFQKNLKYGYARQLIFFFTLLWKTRPPKEAPHSPTHTPDPLPEYPFLCLPSSRRMGCDASCHGQDRRMHTTPGCVHHHHRQAAAATSLDMRWW